MTESRQRMIAARYVDAADIARWNAAVASPPAGWDDNPPTAALKVILDEDLVQVVSGVPLTTGIGVTLLKTPGGRRCAVIVHDDSSSAAFSGDPWYWEKLAYPERGS